MVSARYERTWFFPETPSPGLLPLVLSVFTGVMVAVFMSSEVVGVTEDDSVTWLAVEAPVLPAEVASWVTRYIEMTVENASTADW